MSGLLLAGDIGGTKANLVLVDPAGDARKPLFAERLPTSGFPTLEALLETFLRAAGTTTGGRTASHVCLGIPSPVIDGHVAPVNIHWQAQEETVAKALGVQRVRFLNDLVATALGVPELHGDEIVTLLPGAPRPQGVKMVLAPGTGLGYGYLVHDGTRYRAHGSEGGHGDFGPRGERQRRLHAFLANKDGQINVEAVCSGKGIANLWRFFGHEGLRDSTAVEAQTTAAEDPTPVVMAAAKDPAANPRSAAAAEEFIAILLQEAGNSAVRWMATGGVYLAGGIPPKVIDYLKRPSSLSIYLANPHMARVLRETPLHVVINDEAAVLGAIQGGRALLG